MLGMPPNSTATLSSKIIWNIDCFALCLELVRFWNSVAMMVASVGNALAIAPIMAIITGSDIYFVFVMFGIKGVLSAPPTLARI